MATPFELQVVTPEKIVFSGPVTSLVVPAEDGSLGILAHHAPLLASLGAGKVEIRTMEGTRTWSVKGGLVEVHDNTASVLADAIIE
jgi:F-type H+-transporting ATPase subunit epsilon